MRLGKAISFPSFRNTTVTGGWMRRCAAVRMSEQLSMAVSNIWAHYLDPVQQISPLAQTEEESNVMFLYRHSIKITIDRLFASL